MIVDSLDNIDFHRRLGPRFEKALVYLSEQDIPAMETGKFEVDDGITVSIQRYKSKPASECRLESHEKYADIQYMARGCEKMGYALLTNRKLISASGYNEETDTIFYEGSGDELLLSEGTFAILLPDDAHAPKIMAADMEEEVVKAVVKVRLQ